MVLGCLLLEDYVPRRLGVVGEGKPEAEMLGDFAQWLDAKHSSYLAWSWNTWSCSGGPGLISSYNGTPTNYGMGYLLHILELSLFPGLA